jgi:hypothetical protein
MAKIHSVACCFDYIMFKGIAMMYFQLANMENNLQCNKI